jgi:hypothetical protein
VHPLASVFAYVGGRMCMHVYGFVCVYAYVPVSMCIRNMCV